LIINPLLHSGKHVLPHLPLARFFNTLSFRGTATWFRRFRVPGSQAGGSARDGDGIGRQDQIFASAF
jgi:hypothetical protein